MNSDSLLLRPAVAADVAFIVAIERLPESRKFVGQWSQERHASTLAGSDARYFVAESNSGEIQAFAILRGFAEASRSVELKRLVVASPGRGLGRRIVKQLMRIVFEEVQAHRMYLDVVEDNSRARHVYESLGFVYEGIMREADERDEEFISLYLMSMLDREYHAITSSQAAPPSPL